MGYLISSLILFALALILIKNIFDDKKSLKDKLPIFDKLNISILSVFGFEKEKIFDIKLYDNSLISCGNIRFFGFKEKEKGDRIALIEFQYKSEAGDVFSGLTDNPQTRAQPIENGKTVNYEISINNDILQVFVKVRNQKFIIFEKKICIPTYYEIINIDSKRVEIK